MQGFHLKWQKNYKAIKSYAHKYRLLFVTYYDVGTCFTFKDCQELVWKVNVTQKKILLRSVYTES